MESHANGIIQWELVQLGQCTRSDKYLIGKFAHEQRSHEGQKEIDEG